MLPVTVFAKKFIFLGIWTVLLDGYQCQFRRTSPAYYYYDETDTRDDFSEEAFYQEEYYPPEPFSTHGHQDARGTQSQCKCGMRGNTGKVVGGETASKNEFPWIAALVRPATRRPFCGGSLINNRYILTAAHCVYNRGVSRMEVLLHAHVLDKNPRGSWSDPALKNIPGWNLRTETDKSENSIRVKVADIRVHPMYDDSFDYDFALLKLAQRVDFLKSNVSPICLPLIDQKLTYVDGRTIFTVAGWGHPWEDAPASSRLLQKVDVPFVNRQYCRKYTDPALTHLCAGYLREGGKDACSGDSGGPLIYRPNSDTSQYVLSGVVSAGGGCAREYEPGLYADVQAAMKWIYGTASDGTWCAR